MRVADEHRVRLGDKPCECGCGSPAPIAERNDTRQGKVKGQPQRFVRGHATRKHSLSYIENEDGCWIFDGYIGPTGYGFIGRKPAHRIYYERSVGEIPEGMEIDHLCRVRSCVNPEHLEAVTHAENVRRSPLIGRWSRKEKGIKHAS